MSKDKHIPQGYKDSPLGIIPKEWEVKRLGDLGSFKNGLNFSPNDSGISYYFLGVGDFLNRNVIDVRNLGHIHLKDKLDESYLIKDQDLVFVRSNGSKSLVGRSVLIKSNQEEATYSGFCIRFRSDNKCTTTKYIQHLINVGYLKRFLVYEGRGTNITNLNQDILGRLSFPIPPIAEQDRVLHILSIWDTAIEKQSELVEKLKLRKQALMQQLLTGKKRLPEFSGEWKEVRLGEMLHNLSNGMIYDPTITDGFKITRIETISDGTINMHKVGYCEYEPAKDYKLQKGDILYSHINSLLHIGKVAYYDLDETIYHGMNLLLLRTNELIDSKYLYYLLLSSESRHYALRYAKPAINQASISTSDIKKFKYRIPLIDEQNEIANILNDADKEIELASEKLSSLQSQKRGLMQQLLTGKKRIMQL